MALVAAFAGAGWLSPELRGGAGERLEPSGPADAAAQSLAEQWGVRPEAREPLKLVTHVLVHEGAAHLLGSVVLLLLLGLFLERVWGRILTAILVVGSAVASASFYVIVDPLPGGAWIGASGIVAGLLGAFLVRYGPAAGPAHAFLLLAGAAFLALPLWQGVHWSIAGAAAGAPGASGWALSGAALFGALLAVAIRGFRFEEAILNPEVGVKLAGVATRDLERALEERAAGRAEQAFRLIQGLVRRSPDDRDAALALWDVANELSRPAAAAAALVRVIREEVQRRESGAAVGHWLELSACGLEHMVEPALAIRMAGLLRNAGEPVAAARALRCALERSGEGDDAVVASRVAHAAVELDPEMAEEAAWRALGAVEIDLEERQGLEALLAEIHPKAVSLRQRREREPSREAALARFQHLERAPSTPAASPAPPPQAPVPREGAEPEPSVATPIPIDLDFHSRRLEVVSAVPVGVDDEGIVIEIEGGAKKRVRYQRLEGVSVAAVQGLADRPVIVVDLLLNWKSAHHEPLHLIRLRGDRFDPRCLAEGSAVEALRSVLALLLRRGGAVPLPDRASAEGRPFASFADLSSYQRDVLMVDDSDDDR